MRAIFSVMVAGVVVVATAAAQQPSASEVVRIRVDPRTALAPLAGDFLGLGYETSAVAREGYFSATNSPLVQLYRTLGTNGLARIGGIIGDHTRYEPEGRARARDMRDTTVINHAVLEDFGGFLRATGWKAMWTLNLGSGTKEEAAREARAVSAALGDRLQSFEIGNEVDLLKRFDSYAGYHTAYLEYKAAVRAAVPGAVLSGPDAAVKLDWSVNFARTEAKDMGLLIQHYYRGGAKSDQATIETLLRPHAEWESKLQRLHEACVENGLSFRINEVNSFSGGGKPGVSDTFASALWCLDFMFRVASHGGGGVNMETDVNQLGFVSHYSPIYRGDDGSLTPRPEYYAMLAFALAGQGALVKLSVSETPVNLNAYATKTVHGPVWVALVNKDLARAANIELTLPGGFAGSEVFRLAAPSARSTSGVTLAGTQVTPEGRWSPGAPEKILSAGNVASLALPAASAALVRFPALRR